MTRSLAGDKPAYETLLRKIETMVTGYLMNAMNASMRSEERAEDLVQDVLLAVHRKKHLYRLDMPILPWLFAIVRYRLIDHVRHEKRRPLLVEWEEELDLADASSASLPETEALDVEEILEGLSQKQRDLLVLAKVEKVPLAEIADRFGMSLSAVKVTIHRTVQKLKKRFPSSL